MATISSRTIGPIVRSVCLAWPLCLAALCLPATAQSSSPSAEGSGESNRSGAARGSAATAPMPAEGAARGGRSNTFGDPRSSAAPIGRDGRALSHQPDRAQETKASKGDAQLMRDLAAAHLAEIKMASLATSISGDEAIRLYGQKMLEEHYAALDALRRTARTLGVVLPGGVDTEEAALLRKQAMLTGQEFDKSYLQEAGVALHEQAHKLAESGMKASAPEIREHAALLLPVIEEHGKLAQTMAAEPAKAAAAVRATQRAGQSVFLAQGAPEPGYTEGGGNSGNKGNASVAGRAAGEALK